MSLAGTVLVSAQAASADVTTISSDTSRVGWQQNQPGLGPSNLPSINQQFSSPVSGSVYAQPLVVGSNVIVATENNMVYGIDRNTGDAKWATSVGRPGSSGPDGSNCPYLATNNSSGVTSTPVFDPATGLVFLAALNWDGVNAQSARWFMYALNATTGAVQPGWPVRLTGTASNDPARNFDVDAPVEFQRAGLLLLGGRVYTSFASQCDQGDYAGWIISVSTTTRSQSGWVDEGMGNQGAGVQGGIWHSGGGLASDGSSIFFTSGNGTVPPVGPGSTPTPYLAESVVRLAVDPNGVLAAVDHFAPVDAQARSNQDLDLGSSGPVLLPEGFGGIANKKLVFQGSKTGDIYLLDQSSLGGQAPHGQTDNVVAELNTQSGSTWGHAGAWGGDGGGWLYLAPQEGGSALKAFRAQVVGGKPTLSVAGSTTDSFGGLSGSPVVTSNGTTSGSAVLWVLDRLANTSVPRAPAELRAYNPVPVNGTLQLLKTFPVSSGTKFSVIAADGNQVFLGTEDGRLLAFSAAPSACTTYSSPNTGSHQLCGAVRDKYEALGGTAGFLGFPATDEILAPDGIGKFAHFSSTNNPNFVDGSIYWSPSTGAQSIRGSIRAKWASLGWERSFLGYPVSDEAGTPGSQLGRFNDFANSGSIYWTQATGAWSIHGSIRAKYLALGGAASALGFPATDENGSPDGVGRFNHFTSTNNPNFVDGSIYWSPSTGAQSIRGAIRAKWASMGWELGFLGYPVTDETVGPGGGRFNHFANSGSIYWTQPTGAWSIHGLIRAKYLAMGGPASFLSYPVTDETGTPDGIGRFNHFSSTTNPNFVDGSIYWTPGTGAQSIHGGIRAKWASLGWETGFLGYPVTDETGTPDGIGRFNHFSNSGSIYWTPGTGAWSIHGAIRDKWASMGWERSCLGYPVSDEFAIPGGRQSNLQHGFITYAFSSGRATSSC